MKYLIPFLLGLWTFLMTSGTIFFVYLVAAEHKAWGILAVGLAFLTLVGILATSSAFDAVKSY